MRNVPFILTLFLFINSSLTGQVLPGPAPCGPDVPSDHCESWSRIYNDTSIGPPERSDQFVTAIASNNETVFVSQKSVGLDPNDPYSARSHWQILAYNAGTGAQKWIATRRTRVYDSPLDISVSADGTRVYATGAAYNAFPVSATDSRLVTVAYDANTGAEIWSTTWDGRPDGIDNGLAVAVSTDGSELYAGGITTATDGSLDYVVLTYRTLDGRLLWTRTYSGAKPAGVDALKDIGVSPDGTRVYVTGESSGTRREYDNDYFTVAIRTRGGRRGSVAWEARYDGIGDGRSDRGAALTVAGDGTVLVTGDSAFLREDGSTRFDAVTIAYTPTGSVRWETRSVGPYGLEFGNGVESRGNVVAVLSQSRGADAQSGLDTTTILYDLATGSEVWQYRSQESLRSELPSAPAISADASTVFTLSSERPVIDYTSLYEMVLRAHRASTGEVLWTTRIDAGTGNSVKARGVNLLPDGRLAITGTITFSQNPLEPPSQNLYDTITALIAPM